MSITARTLRKVHWLSWNFIFSPVTYPCNLSSGWMWVMIRQTGETGSKGKGNVMTRSPALQVGGWLSWLELTWRGSWLPWNDPPAVSTPVTYPFPLTRSLWSQRAKRSYKTRRQKTVNFSSHPIFAIKLVTSYCNLLNCLIPETSSFVDLYRN